MFVSVYNLVNVLCVLLAVLPKYLENVLCVLLAVLPKYLENVLCVLLAVLPKYCHFRFDMGGWCSPHQGLGHIQLLQISSRREGKPCNSELETYIL